MRDGYIHTTLLYGVVGLFAFTGVIWAFLSGRWFLGLIFALALYVAWDNFFCGSRARKAGWKVKGHYVVPPFLTGK